MVQLQNKPLEIPAPEIGSAGASQRAGSASGTALPHWGGCSGHQDPTGYGAELRWQKMRWLILSGTEWLVW